MKYKPRKIYEYVYIHAGKVLTADGWVLLLLAMDGYSQYAFEHVLDKEPRITLDVLNQLFRNILKDYKPIFHPRQIVFVTSLSIECDQLLKRSIAGSHRFVYNKEVTVKAMKELLGGMPFNLFDL
jgi:hypothetical protein